MEVIHLIMQHDTTLIKWSLQRSCYCPLQSLSVIKCLLTPALRSFSKSTTHCKLIMTWVHADDHS